ncbi:MAG TPA: DUF6703 family protein, partial [Candidatus Nanopelagicales bacterium]|nr:DUF6703 family protein [Candidatus Nanopelagicales bacterium]
GARRVLEVRSVGLLSTLHRMPRWLVPLLLAVFLVLGLVLPTRWAGLLLVLIAGFLGWLLALSWPLLDGRGRAVRALVVLALAVVAVLRLLGSF